MRYIYVKLLNGFAKPLIYSIPESWPTINLHGSLVSVPLQKRIETGYVIGQTDQVKTSFAIKPAHALHEFPADPYYQQFLDKLSFYYQVEPIHFIKRIKQFIGQEQTESLVLSNPVQQFENKQLTVPQQEIVNQISQKIGMQSYYPALLHGVTGSGKTEVYKQLILDAFAKNKTTLLLLPEVSLAIHFQHLLQAQLGNTIAIFGFHSGTNAKDKKRVWQHLLEQKPFVLIGVHIPVLLPISNLGLILIDEEHEVGYQEKKHPKINSKEAALLRAQLLKIPILLGSATPSLASLAMVKEKKCDYFHLSQRFAGAFPAIEIVSLLDKTKKRPHFWISKELFEAIQNCLAKKEQVIIFLNRRGYSFFVQCKSCSFIFECQHCSVSLTLHGNDRLICHYCGFEKILPPHCQCNQKDSFLKKGIGTQQAAALLAQLFPAARIARADLDVSSKKKVWQKTMEDFAAGSIDILVGTQTITKGFHFPKVTLVGILWADVNLHFPIYNATEISLQQLIQVAGRAGRVSAKSKVIIQTMMNHPIFSYLSEADYLKYYDYESKNRALVGYPPFIRLAQIELKHTDEQQLQQEALQLAKIVEKKITDGALAIQLLGPTIPPLAKIKNIHTRKIYLKSKSMAVLINLFASIDHSAYKSSIFFTPSVNS